MSNNLIPALFVGLLLFVPLIWGELVPRIQLDGYELEPTSIGYILRITQENGTAYRNEDVKQLYPGAPLIVEGTIRQEYKGKDGKVGNLTVTYHAGEKGTLAKYIYESANYITQIVVKSMIERLNAATLKTAAG